MKVKDVIKKEAMKIVPIVIVTAIISVFATSAHCKTQAEKTMIKIPSSNVGIVKIYDPQSKSVKEYEGKIFISEINATDQRAISVEMGDAKQISETKYTYIGTK